MSNRLYTVTRLGKLHLVDYEGGLKMYWFYCPACQHGHPFEVPRWSFDGNIEAPTFSPSLRMYYTQPETKQEKTTCHLHIEKGVLKFCDDCPHEFRGKKVPMVDWPVDYHRPGEPYE